MNVKGELCGPCKDAGFPNILAHYQGVKAGTSKDGRAKPAMCWDHYHGKEPKHILKQRLSGLVVADDSELAPSAEIIPSGKGTVMPLPSSMELSKKGINTSQDFARLMSAVMSDLIAGAIEPETAKAVCTAGDRLLRIVEMQIKHGKPGTVLKLTE